MVPALVFRRPPDPHLGRVGSTIDFPGYFLSPTGKSNPDRELEATLASFFDDTPLFDEPRQCRFKARYEWLKQALNFDPERLPPSTCARFDVWFAALDPGALTLVFASNDLNSPSSMFGHTLLRVDPQGAQREQRLLGYAVNYAATTPQDAGLLYAVKGLTGFYQGHFSVLPYYDKVKEYERFEHRDLWEYPLLLDASARTRLLWHLWEWGVASDYYFFSENCSYQLLSLLEVAEPGLSLTAAFQGTLAYAIPLDTVRAAQKAGIVGEPIHRPAQAHRLQHHFAALTPTEQDWVLDYRRGHADLNDPRLALAAAERQAGMLEVAHDILYFDYQSQNVPRQEGVAPARPLLLARSRISAESPFLPVPRPPVQPDAGHGSGRAGLGIRHSRGAEPALLISARPAYHDRLDPPGGYLAAGGIEFLAVELALRDSNLRLDQLELIHVQAVAPRDALFTPWSWFASVGLERAFPLRQAPGSLGASVELGYGAALAPSIGLQLWAFPALALRTHRTWDEGYDLGAGLRLGASAQLQEQISAELSADVIGGMAGEAAERQRATLALQWHLDRGAGVRLGWRWQRQGHEASDDALELRALRYF